MTSDPSHRWSRAIRRTHVVETLAGLVVAAVFAWFAASDFYPPLTRLGNAWVAAWGIWVIVALHRQRRAGVDGGIGELAAHRALLAGVWRWYLGPLVPGLALILVGFGLASGPWWPGVAAVGVGVAAILAGVGELNARAVRSLDREIDGRKATADPWPSR